MSDNNDKNCCRELIERYCNIIDANAAIIRHGCDNSVRFECLSRAECEKKFGGCRNEKYGNNDVQGTV